VVKTLVVKNFGKKAAAKDWRKKLGRMLTYIANRQSSISSKTKLNESIPHVDEHNKTNSIFSRICLVPHASDVLCDDGEVHYRVYDPWLIYKQTIT